MKKETKGKTWIYTGVPSGKAGETGSKTALQTWRKLPTRKPGVRGVTLVWDWH